MMILNNESTFECSEGESQIKCSEIKSELKKKLGFERRVRGAFS